MGFKLKKMLRMWKKKYRLLKGRRYNRKFSDSDCLKNRKKLLSKHLICLIFSVQYGGFFKENYMASHEIFFLICFYCRQKTLVIAHKIRLSPKLSTETFMVIFTINVIKWKHLSKIVQQLSVQRYVGFVSLREFIFSKVRKKYLKIFFLRFFNVK